MDKVIFYVKGMVCQNCERTIVKALQAQAGVIEVKINFPSEKAVVSFNPDLTGVEEIKKTIEALGYSVGEKENKLTKAYKAAPLLMIMVAVLLLANKLSSLLPQINEKVSYGVLFGIGILTSFHCIAMCGGINLSQSIQNKSSVRKSLKRPLLYNAGRLLSYTIIGAAVGGLGQAITLTGQSKGTVTVIAGILMVLFALRMLGIIRFVRFPSLAGVLSKLTKPYQNGEYGPFVIGLLNGLMPCGPLQMMQLYALGTGSITGGALSMLVFSLGTTPLMLGLGALGTILTRSFAKQMVKVSGVLIIALGLIMVGRGFTLWGISIPNPFIQPVQAKDDVQVKLKDGKQVIYMIADAYWYSTDSAYLQKGVPVRLIIEGKKVTGCNSTFIIPEYGIQKDLTKGENIVEFTPDETGYISYSCWMGMVRGQFIVLDKTKGNDQGSPSGTPPSSSYQPKASQQDTVIKNNEQVITMEVYNGLADPPSFLIQSGLKTKWIIHVRDAEKDGVGLQMPGNGIAIVLHDGENIINLPPQEPGTLYFVLPNMQFPGEIGVVKDISKPDGLSDDE